MRKRGDCFCYVMLFNKFLCILLFLLVLSVEIPGISGTNRQGAGRVHNGEPIQPLPFVGALTYTQNVFGFPRIRTFCSASIISPDRLLTAAHCYQMGLRERKLRFIWGLPDITSLNTGVSTTNNPFLQIRSISLDDFVMHPNFDRRPPAYNDIAIVRLKQPLVMRPSGPQPICLANATYVNGVRTVGFGQRNCLPASTDVLQTAMGFIWDRQRCTNSFQDIGMAVKIAESQICSTFRNRRGDSAGASVGDSGGPLYSSNGSVPVQIGLLSFLRARFPPIPSIWNCVNTETPQIFTNVTSYQSFIIRNAPDAEFC